MKYYIIAGEASGDLHGSNLMKGILERDPQADIRFWGGSKMAEVGGTLVVDYKEGAVMGLTDILSKAGKLLGNLRFCKRDILSFAPDVVILIDYPGFNMKIAAFCHKKGIKVNYYIPPKTWASREGRNKKLRKYVDMTYIIFPFEIPYFTAKSIPFIYKGNPLVDTIDSALAEKGKDGQDSPAIAVLAGSRAGEIARTMPVCMAVADRLHAMNEYKDYRFIVCGAPSRSSEDYNKYIGDRAFVSLRFGSTYEIIATSRAAIVNSGTASLETALIGTPQVVCWSTSPLTALIARKVLHVMDHIKYISLGNLIINKLAFKELIQEDFNEKQVSEEVIRLISDSSYRESMIADYKAIRKALSPADPPENDSDHRTNSVSYAIADSIINHLNK